MIRNKREFAKSVCAVIFSVLLSNLIMWAFIHCIVEETRLEDKRVADRMNAKREKKAYEADTTIQLYDGFRIKSRYASVDRWPQ